MLRASILWLVTLAGFACGDPCRDLSEKVCRCESTESAQQSCLRRLDAEAASRSINDEQAQQCQDILDAKQCSCDALGRGELQACGLAYEGP